MPPPRAAARERKTQDLRQHLSEVTPLGGFEHSGRVVKFPSYMTAISKTLEETSLNTEGTHRGTTEGEPGGEAHYSPQTASRVALLRWPVAEMRKRSDRHTIFEVLPHLTSEKNSDVSSFHEQPSLSCVTYHG